MKLIFDFDDTLSNNKLIKQRIFECLEEVGILRSESEKYYDEVRSDHSPFSLKNFITNIFSSNKIDKPISEIYEKILEICPSILNKKLLDLVHKIGKENCYLVTNGDFEYQNDKINKSGISGLFSEVVVVPGSKKQIIEKICFENLNEKVIFVDNKERFFADLDMEKCKNLKTVLFDEQGLENLEIALKG